MTPRTFTTPLFLGAVFWFAAYASYARAETTPGGDVPGQVPLPVSTAAPLPLPRALQLFQSRRLAIVAARHDVSARRAGAIAAGLWQNPTLSLGGHAFTHGAVTGGREELSAMVSQVLPVTGYIGLRKEAANAAASAEEVRFAAITWDLTGEVKRAYVDLLFARDQFAALSAGLADLERVEHVLEERTRAGANPAYDRLRLQIERDTLRARLADSEAVLVGARAELARTVGGDTTPLEVDGAVDPGEPLANWPVAQDDGSDEALVKRALERRPEMEVARRETNAATLRTSAARRRYVPEPELGLGYVRYFDVPNADPASGGAILANLSLPLPLFDRGQGTITQHVEEVRAATVRAAIVKEEIAREVSRAAALARVRRAAYDRHRTGAAKNAEQVRRVAELTYREGRATIVELLDAYSAYLRVREQTVALRMGVLRAGVDLEQAVGP
jgi:cobalt-zinc-cadmium efflux system outer membrane protein